MASISGTSQEQRRWLVVGIALHHVLTPCLKDKIKAEMTPFYQHLVRSFGLDKQTYPTFLKNIPSSTVNLNYESINNNHTATHRSLYDYCVKDEVSLAKLFMKPFMAKFNAFDSNFDSSAALAVLCGASPFTSVKSIAEDVRSKVRNEWAHCNFTAWTGAHYDRCFDVMEALAKNINFGPTDEARLLDQLTLWRTQGLEICLGKAIDDKVLHLFKNEVQRLSDSLEDYNEKERKDIKSICSTLALFKSQFDRAVEVLKNQNSKLESTCEELRNNQESIEKEIDSRDKGQSERLRKLELQEEMRQKQVVDLYRILEVKNEIIKKDVEILKAEMENLPFSSGSKDVIFEAPSQNKWFTGREEIIEKLERYLLLNNDEGVKMAALCGLGGCGKTTIGAQFARKHKADYEAGVFWISMEDDKKLENSMNDLALRLGIWADSFDLTLSKVLTWISNQKKPWLLVLDDVDQLHLSDQMHKILSGRWKRQAKGHILLTTRREPKVVNQSTDFEETRCVEIFEFSEQEAKSFIVTRCGGIVTEDEGGLDELVLELGCLPLALEQAGAHIKALQCPIRSYLEEYKVQRIKLLSQHPRPKPSWEYESKNRLAVHTTWLLNFDYVQKSTHGEIASRFVEAAAFLEPTEIQEELINSSLLSSGEPPRENCKLTLPLKNEIVQILTKFSLFQRRNFKSLTWHRLVQEVIRDRMTVENTTCSSLLKAIGLVNQSLCDCPSPDQILLDIAANVEEQPSTDVRNPSLFYMWSKLTIHASEIQKHLKTLLDQQNITRDVKSVVLTHEASRVVYENAVYLSAHGHQEEAKEAERFGFQILDSCASVAVTFEELRRLFPHTLPLPPLLQKIIIYSSLPPRENPYVDRDENHVSADVNEMRLQGNAFFKTKCFVEAAELYTKALEASNGKPDPRLFNNRATAYLKLRRFKECVKDSEEYINAQPNCWKGYTRKALALDGLGRRDCALCFAAVAYYQDTKCSRQYQPFQSVFKDVDGNWAVAECSKTLEEALKQNKNSGRRKVLLLQIGQYDVCGMSFQGMQNSLHMVAISQVHGATLKTKSFLLNSVCCFQNIIFETQNSVRVLENAKVEFDQCKFHCSSVDEPAIHVFGTANCFQCKVTKSKGGGILVEGCRSSASLIKCHISGNGNRPLYWSGIRTLDDGRLFAQECLIQGNTEGVHFCGRGFRLNARETKVIDCEIYDNKYEGIIVAASSHASTDIVIQGVTRSTTTGFSVFVFRAA